MKRVMRRFWKHDPQNKWRYFWTKLFSAAVGLFALVWFLIRVIPKPSRATYPCQRVAFPIASSFVAYLVGIFTTAAVFRQAKKRLHQSRYVLAGVCIFVGFSCALITVSIDSGWVIGADYAPFTPPDPPNTPIGTGIGINPGRVVWVHDPEATSWDGDEDYYWDDNHTDQDAVDQMISECLRRLTGETTDEAAWDALFRNFNQTHEKGNIGYQAGEKIAIKPNHVENRAHDDYDNKIDVCPQVTLALLRQMVYKGGVDPNRITLCDPTRFVSDKIYDRLYAEFPTMVFRETTFYNPENNPGTAGREMVIPSDTGLVYYSDETDNPEDELPPVSGDTDRLATCLVEAEYMINLAILKGHKGCGVTLCGKNLYGAPCDRNPNFLHNTRVFENNATGQYRIMVDLMGHQHLGGKTLLYMIDGLYGTWRHANPPDPWTMAPFNNDYPSSLFLSQDPVAIDSVGLDFVYTEWADEWSADMDYGNAVDDYLHEAALADNPPSGTIYTPDGPDKSASSPYRLSSLGVHEHWNNATDKQYSRNLGTGSGIELTSITITNHWPQVYAGVDQITALEDGAINISGVITDDGLPAVPGEVTPTWSKFEGPGDVTFGDEHEKITTAAFSKCGTYILRLTADDGDLTRSDDITVTVTMDCDLYPDCQINLKDFGIFSYYWLGGNCNSSNDWCQGADNDNGSRNGNVDSRDLFYFSSYWLK